MRPDSGASWAEWKLTKDVRTFRRPPRMLSQGNSCGGGRPGTQRPVGRDMPEGWVVDSHFDDLTSVGVVTNEKKKIPEKRFSRFWNVQACPLKEENLLRSMGEGFVHEGLVYSHKRFVGSGWMMVGDAACFTDPILSGELTLPSVEHATSIALLRMFGEGGTHVMEPLLHTRASCTRIRSYRGWPALVCQQPIGGWSLLGGPSRDPRRFFSTPLRTFNMSRVENWTPTTVPNLHGCPEKRCSRPVSTKRSALRSRRAKTRHKTAGINQTKWTRGRKAAPSFGGEFPA